MAATRPCECIVQIRDKLRWNFFGKSKQINDENVRNTFGECVGFVSDIHETMKNMWFATPWKKAKSNAKCSAQITTINNIWKTHLSTHFDRLTFAVQTLSFPMTFFVPLKTNIDQWSESCTSNHKNTPVPVSRIFEWYTKYAQKGHHYNRN